MTIQAHADAILDRLRAALTTYPEPGSPKTVPDDAEPPYVVVHLHREFGDPEGMDGATSRVAMRAYCHCVGADAVGARAVSQLVADALLDYVPTVEGRACFPIRHEQSIPARPDETTGRLVVDLTEVYRLESVPG